MRILRSCGLFAAAFLLGSAGQTRAGFDTDTLGSAGPGNYGILTLIGTTNIALNGTGSTTGNVGISSPGTLSLNSSNGNPAAAINGNVYLGNTARITNPQQVKGTVLTHQDTKLDQANAAAVLAAVKFASRTPTLSVPGSAINGTMTITGGAGVNVLNITGLNLGNRQTLTLTGPAGSQFVINDSGGFTLNSGKIILAGGLTPSDVVFNVTGIGLNLPALSISGGVNGESVVNGILLAPGRSVQISSGLINGEVIAGGPTFNFDSSGSIVESPPGQVAPPPRSAALMVLGGIVLVALVVRTRRRPAIPSC
jgi:choice-of-anchor A domain-containing protein